MHSQQLCQKVKQRGCCRGCLRPSPQCQRHEEHEERSLLPFLPLSKLLLYIVNKQLTQAKEAKNTSLHFLDAEKINQCNPILGQRWMLLCTAFLQLLQTLKFFAVVGEEALVNEGGKVGAEARRGGKTRRTTSAAPNIHNVYVYQANQALWSRAQQVVGIYLMH